MWGRFVALASRPLIEWVKGRVYRKGHLLHADGSLYMGRYYLFETRWLSARVHHIATADIDRHCHDHPWTFLSIVLRGGYVESRPITLDPCFRDTGDEVCRNIYRHTGSIALRLATDRHKVSWVARDTWSLFVYGPKRQWWGFYTPHGKIHFPDYPSMYLSDGGINSSINRKESQ